MKIYKYSANQKYTNYDIVIIPKEISTHEFLENNVECPGVIGEIEITEEEINSLIKNLLEGNKICFLGDEEHCIFKKL